MSEFLWSDDGPVSITAPPGKQPLPEVTEEGVYGGEGIYRARVGVQDQEGWGSSPLLLAVSPTLPLTPHVHPGHALLASPAP